LEVLGDLSMKLLHQGNLEGNFHLGVKIGLDKNSLNDLNSSGILIYYDDLLDPKVNLSSFVFAWFGIAYHLQILQKSEEKLKLYESFEAIEKLPKKNKDGITSLLKEFGLST
jgi:hypothetical protein